MIAPKKEEPAEADVSALRRETDDFFRPGGRLEIACRNEPFPYEPRLQQREMADAIAEAIMDEDHLVVEAGTGVGKSFAYLVPLILAAVRKNVHAVVSTYTIALQEQLIAKDIPFLQEHMGVKFKAVLVKGRSNYLCLRRLARARKMGGELFVSETAAEIERIRAWADRTKEGSLQDLEEQPASEAWDMVCAEQGNCMWNKCPEYSRCFFMSARKRIRDANLLVVNHHLLFSELAIRAHGASFLPPYSMVVLDEANMVENVASEHMGIRLSRFAFEYWMRRLYTPDNSKGLLALLKKGETAHEVTRLWEETERFFVAVRKWARFSGDESQRVVSAPLDIPTAAPDILGRIIAQLGTISDGIKDEDLRAELSSLRRRGGEMKDALEAYLKQALRDQVYWVEREGRRKQQMVLYSAPIEVGPLLEKALFEGLSTVVMTSATLAIGGNLEYFKSRMGAPDCRVLSLGSPFDYGRQMRVYIPSRMPDPNETDRFIDAAAQAIRFFVTKTHGRAFVLFTSSSLMKQVAEVTADYFESNGIRLLVQGTGSPRHVMLQRFKADNPSVLFGLDSFWMGVDVRGSALSNVIITRLPFAVPDQPLIKARMDRIREKGGDPFRDYSLPEAILKFRQGVGRLIRTATDEGIVVILDPRIVGKWYGKLFLSAIPECPVEIVDL